MSEPINDRAAAMSTKELERLVFDIMTDNGMDEDTADKNIDSMSRHDMEEYVSSGMNDNDEDDE